MGLRWIAAGVAALMAVPAWGQVSPSNFTSATRYDAMRRVTGTIAPNPMGSYNGFISYQAVRNTYDAAGRLIRVESGYLTSWQPETVAPQDWGVAFVRVTQTEASYDAMGRKTVDRAYAVVSGAATTVERLTQYSYDAVGRLECTAVRMNPSVYGDLGSTSACVLGTAGSHGSDRITKNVYDTVGQLVQVRKGVGTGAEQAYATYEYTANSKQKTVIDANGNKASLTWDGFDRQSGWYFPSTTMPGAFNPASVATVLATAGSASTTDYEVYDYDANGNRLSLRKRDGRVISYGYDALNRMTSKIVPDCATITPSCPLSAAQTRDVYYSYDLRGLQTAARFDSLSGSDAVLSTWDGFGRQTGSTTAMGGVSRTLTSTYTANGERDRLTWPDDNFVSYYRYDTGQTYSAASNGSALLYHPVLDAASRVGMVQRIDTSLGIWKPGVQYDFDGLSRISSSYQVLTGGTGNVTTGFGYNPANQIVSKTRDNDGYAFNAFINVGRGYARNGLNQYTSAGPATFSYDANGNLTGDGTTSYTYDVGNRLVGASNGAMMSYDPTGRLWQTSGTANGTTRFLYDGDALVAEYDAAGTMTARYVHGDGDDDPMVAYAGAGLTSPSFLYADHQGSIVALTDTNGVLTQINRYDEYGIPGIGNSGRFQYTGQAWMPDIGMYHYKARIYSPTLGRFLQTDPIGYDDQVNLYAYVGNDPLNRSDPSGLFGCGSELKGAACDQFKADQAAAAKQLIAAIKTVRSLASDLAAGNKLNSAERAAQTAIDKYQGAGTGSDVKFLSKFAAAGDKIVSALNSNFPVQPHSQVGTSYASVPAGLVKAGPAYIYPNYYKQSNSTRQETWPHEGSHFSLGARDYAYGSVDAARLARDNPAAAQNSADNIALGFGFHRDD